MAIGNREQRISYVEALIPLVPAIHIARVTDMVMRLGHEAGGAALAASVGLVELVATGVAIERALQGELWQAGLVYGLTKLILAGGTVFLEN